MKKIFPFLFTLLVLASCGKDDDDNGGDSSIFGIWNVTEKYTYSCNGQNFENNFSYQISVSEWKTDSILVTNLFEQNWTFYGYYSGSSLAIDLPPYGECLTTGIVNNNSVALNSNCTNKNFNIDIVINNGCDANVYWDEQYSVAFTATKQ
jgi:hypothetical protein